MSKVTHTAAIVALTLVLVLGVVPVVAPDVGSETAVRTVSGPLVPPGNEVLVGAWVAPREGWTDTARRDAVVEHEAHIGRRLDVVNEFFAFTKPWATERLEWHLGQGRTPMVSWNGTYAEEILSGKHDLLIRDRARIAVGLGERFFLRFFWEVDAAKGGRWGYHDDPKVFRHVWAYVRAIFSEEGADDYAVWVWSPTTWNFTTGDAQRYYPGDNMVDWIAADGYLWTCRGARAASFEEVYRDFLSWASAVAKPIMAAEWGADVAGDEIAFVESVPAMLKRHPNVAALVYFDAVDPGGRGCDWRIDSTGEMTAAYRSLVNSRPFTSAVRPLEGHQCHP